MFDINNEQVCINITVYYLDRFIPQYDFRGGSLLKQENYSLKDYNNILLKPTNDFIGENNYMSTALKTASEFRVGAEYKIEKWSLRGGYNFEESPYKDSKVIGDLYGITGGLGYNFGDFKIDLAYAYSKRNFQNQLLKVK